MTFIPRARLALITLLPLACAACATTSETTAQAHEENGYRTGSHIPVAANSSSSEVKTVDPSTIQDVMRPRTGSPGTVSPH